MTNTSHLEGRSVGHYAMVWDGQVFDTYRNSTTLEVEPVAIGTVLREMRGVRGVSIVRADGSLVVENAGALWPSRRFMPLEMRRQERAAALERRMDEIAAQIRTENARSSVAS